MLEMEKFWYFVGRIFLKQVFPINTAIALMFVLPGMHSQPQNLSTCNSLISTELPKIYPKHLTSENVFPGEIINANDLNSTLAWSRLVYQKCKVRLELECNASYPIEWVEHYDQNIEKLTDVSNNIRKDLWTDRILNEALLGHTITNIPIDMPGFTSYIAFLGLNYIEPLCAAANYTCRSVSNPCLQSTVVSAVDPKRETIRYKQLSNIYDNSSKQIQNSTCETFIEVKIVRERGRIGWKCKSSRKNQDLFLFSRPCDAAVHCNSYFTHYNAQSCVKLLPDSADCKGCWFKDKTVGFLRHPGYVWCENENKEILAVAHYFFSIPQSVDKDEIPDLYLNWEKANPQKMLYLEPLAAEIYAGETKQIFCKISRYFFSFGHRFGFEYKNGTMKYTSCLDGEHDLSQNVNRMNVTISFVDPSLQRVYCFAPVWNSTVWVNQSAEIHIRDDGISPSFVASDKSASPESEEKIIFDLHQRNATVTCNATGQPTPKIKWMFYSSNAASNEVEMDQDRRDLVFQYVTESINGKYKCVASNYLGTSTKVFNVNVRDKFGDYIRITSILAAVFTVTFILLLGFCWMKVKQQKGQLRALTDAEIIEFRRGNISMVENKVYLDTQELLEALPYNEAYEIPIKNLYVDSSEVLGSGNFGQVLKGVVFDNQNRKICKTVAVKTTKPKYDITYFQTLLTEVKIMAYIGHHINVVGLVGACTENIKNRQIYIAVEFCSGGSLDKFLKNNRSCFINLVCDDTIHITTSLCEKEGEKETCHVYQNVQGTSLMISTIHLLKWSREIANGMEFLGSKKIIHGDLAARNILLTDDLISKICDFGLSRVMTYSNYIRSSQDNCILPWAWLAPEILQELKFSVPSDVWSYGVTIWEIFSLAQHPYPGTIYNTAFLDWLKNGHRMHKPFCANSQIYNLMMDCWSLEPSQRTTFQDLKDSFEGLLLQACNSDYIHTACNDTIQYINGSNNLRAQNPGYTVLGAGNISFQNEEDGQSTNWVHTSPLSEDYQGYLKPLMGSFEDDFKD